MAIKDRIDRISKQQTLDSTVREEWSCDIYRDMLERSEIGLFGDIESFERLAGLAVEAADTLILKLAQTESKESQ